MLKKFICCILISNFAHANTLTLSRDIYQAVPFSSQFSEDGALIRNVHYPSVNALIPQLNALYQLDLEDRGESHITVITPPDFNSSLNKVFNIQEILARYSGSIQDHSFQVLCVGSQKSSNGKNQVFYLVVESTGIRDIRFDLAQEANLRAQNQNIPMVFKPEVFWPHITIGYVNGDVFEYDKGLDSCLRDVKFEIR